MAPPKAGELLAESIEILRSHLKWSYADLGGKLGKSRQWAYKVATGRQDGTTVTSLEQLAYVFTEGAKSPISVGDLFNPRSLQYRLTKGVTASVSPSSNTPSQSVVSGVESHDAADLRDKVSGLEREIALLTTVFFDCHAALDKLIRPRAVSEERDRPRKKTARSGRASR